MKKKKKKMSIENGTLKEKLKVQLVESISQSDAKAIESISFGIVNGDGSESDIYVDNIRLLKNVGYSDNTVDDIDQEVRL